MVKINSKNEHINLEFSRIKIGFFLDKGRWYCLLINKETNFIQNIDDRTLYLQLQSKINFNWKKGDEKE